MPFPTHCAPPPARRRRTWAIAAATLIASLAGCASPRGNPHAEAAIAAAAGFPDAIAFRTEGGPLDEPSPADNTALSLADAVRRALATDPALEAALARVRIAMADADQARLLPNPILNLVIRWGPGSPQIEVSLAQDLIQTLRIPRQASAADNRLRQAAADAVTVALDTLAEVQERYIAAQALQALLPVLDERRDLLDRLATTAQARLDAGEGIRGDLSSLQAQRLELEVDLAETREQLQENRLRLARLIGEPSSAAQWTLDPWSTPALPAQSEARWFESALAHRPEVQSAAWRLAALSDDEALARLLPWDGASLGVDAQRDGDWTVGPSISTPIPIFDMGQAKKARVAAEQSEARHDLTLASRRVVEEVRLALASLSANTATLRRIHTELVPLQQTRRQHAEDAFRAGHTDVTPLYLAEHDLGDARAREIEVERQAALALLHLQRAVGGPGVAKSVSTSNDGTPQSALPVPQIAHP